MKKKMTRKKNKRESRILFAFIPGGLGASPETTVARHMPQRFKLLLHDGGDLDDFVCQIPLSGNLTRDVETAFKNGWVALENHLRIYYKLPQY